MFRFATVAVLCLAATPALAQNQTAPSAPAGPPPAAMAAIQEASMAFGQCIQTAVPSVPATVTPEAGAANVLAGCSVQRQAVEQAAQVLIAALPEESRAAAQEQLRTQLGGVQAQIVAGIQQMRAASAPAAAPAPAQ